MPQIYYQQISAQTQLALWQITEPESFFQQAAFGIRAIAHPHKRLQHLCGRYLLQLLVPTFPLQQIVAEHNNKPFLPSHPYHFSISHCDDYVAAIVSTTLRVGIDVETITSKVAAIRHKFLNAAEESMLAATELPIAELEKLTLAWSAKETMFKWLGEQGVDFKTQLLLQQFPGASGPPYIQAIVRRRTEQPVTIYLRMLAPVALTWLAN